MGNARLHAVAKGPFNLHTHRQRVSGGPIANAHRGDTQLPPSIDGSEHPGPNGALAAASATPSTPILDKPSVKNCVCDSWSLLYDIYQPEEAALATTSNVLDAMSYVRHQRSIVLEFSLRRCLRRFHYARGTTTHSMCLGNTSRKRQYY